MTPLGRFLGFLNFFIFYFEGYSADACPEKFPVVSLGGWAEGLACADLGARTPIGTSGNL